MTWTAGFGRATINPPVPVRLAGFGDRTTDADHIHDDLEVHALWISDGTASACLLVFDLLGLSPAFADPVRAAVAADLSLARDDVLTSCTHTHAGPNAMTGGDALGWRTPDGYGETLVAGARAAAREARGDARGATLRYARSPLPDDVSLNRRQHPYDPWFTALAFVGDDGARIGTIANVAIHPVSLGSPWLAVSSDWVGPCRDALVETLGGSAILLSGALGDVNPTERHTDVQTHLTEAHAEASTIGATVGRAVVAAVRDASLVDGALTTSARTITVPAEGMLASLLGITEDTVELIEWTIGDVALVAVPGEAFHALGHAIDAARGGRCLIAGLAPTWHGYLPVPFTDGYEETVSLGKVAVDRLATALIAGPEGEA